MPTAALMGAIQERSLSKSVALGNPLVAGSVPSFQHANLPDGDVRATLIERVWALRLYSSGPQLLKTQVVKWGLVCSISASVNIRLIEGPSCSLVWSPI